MTDPKNRSALLVGGESVYRMLPDLLSGGEPVQRIMATSTYASDTPVVMPDFKAIRRGNSLYMFNLLYGPEKIELAPTDVKYDNGTLSFAFEQHGGVVMDAVRRMFGGTLDTWGLPTRGGRSPRRRAHGRFWTKREKRAAVRQRMNHERRVRT